MPIPHITFEQVNFRWPDGPGLEGVSFSIDPGDFVMLRGPSGAGKSTLLRLMVRFEEPQAGMIRFQGTPLVELDPMRLRRSVALLQQTPVMGNESIRDALLLPYTFASAQGLPRPDDAALRVRLESVGLHDLRLDQPAATLSVGQKQRLALARVLGLRPAVLLLDEPTSALDAENRLTVEQLFEQANADGVSVIFITHTDYQPARPYRVLRVHEGTVHDEGFGPMPAEPAPIMPVTLAGACKH